MTRLADVTGLTPFGIPVFQAVRPSSQSLSVSQGKGLTPTAAKISALLEASELYVAEQLQALGPRKKLAALSEDARRCWSDAPRRDGAIVLDAASERHWINGTCLVSGRAIPVPFDMISLDFTRPAQEDVQASSTGLATGNDVAEATCGALAELLERDLSVDHERSSPAHRLAAQVDLATIDDRWIRFLVERVERAGFDLRLWSLSQELRVAAFRCVIVGHGITELPPTAGSGCHPSRTVATLRAILEAIQVHATLVAGARDDLIQAHYDEANGRKFEMIMGALGFGRGSLAWSSTSDTAISCPAQALDALIEAAASRTKLPLISIEHDSGVPGLSVMRVVAPDLTEPSRDDPLVALAATPPRHVTGTRGPVVFIGPSLEGGAVPDGVEALGPAICGDLTRLLLNPPAAVGLVDGCFATSPSVWHKEIIALIANGIPVLGAGSLGAMRAAELAAYGMVGVGQVFSAYRNGAVVRDDAVMLVHAPAELGWRALTLALVDAEDALRSVPLSDRDRRMMQRIVRTMPYTRRTWSACFAAFKDRAGHDLPATIEHSLRQHGSLKHRDALMLLRILKHRQWINPRRIDPPELTGSYAQLVTEIMSAPV